MKKKEQIKRRGFQSLALLSGIAAAANLINAGSNYELAKKKEDVGLAAKSGVVRALRKGRKTLGCRNCEQVTSAASWCWIFPRSGQGKTAEKVGMTTNSQLLRILANIPDFPGVSMIDEYVGRKKRPWKEKAVINF